MEGDIVDTRFKLPGSLVIVGSSGAGKTELVISLLDPEKNEAVFGEVIDNIYWIYSIHQPSYDRLKLLNPKVQFVQSFSQVPKTLRGKTVLVFDDQMLNFQSNRKAKKDILEIFYKTAHHKNIFNITIFQTLHGHGLRSAVLNAQYLIIFPIKSDVSQVRHVSAQMFPNLPSSFLVNSLIDAGKDRWGFLLLDRSPNQDPRFTVRNFVFPKLEGKFYNLENGGDSKKRAFFKTTRKVSKKRRRKTVKKRIKRPS